jgi:hypothetical protein
MIDIISEQGNANKNHSEIIISPVRNERDWNPQTLLILIQNHAAILENNLAALLMIKHRVPL